ncbi:hypothetical protein [Mycolicibacterium vinylchloridicum]|uniref:hypothetical protein n=1 Tax=Mycolicibacterium vinylchloridicum TaxID=2736928 RepID=UPI0015C8F357|nr:hypothetical protein [Mycolicibacterium vinylchloridicum]
MAMWASNGIWNGAGAAGRAVRRGLSGPQTRKPPPLQFRTRTPPQFLRDHVLRQVAAAPQASVSVGLYLNSVSPQSISYAYGDVINTSFTAELHLEPELAGTKGYFAITNWTQCGGDVSDTYVMNELGGHIDACVRSMDPAAEFQRL